MLTIRAAGSMVALVDELPSAVGARQVVAAVAAVSALEAVCRNQVDRFGCVGMRGDPGGAGRCTHRVAGICGIVECHGATQRTGSPPTGPLSAGFMTGTARPAGPGKRYQ